MLLAQNVASRHKCPSSQMGPDRFTAANAIRSIDLLDHLVDHLVDTKPSVFINDLFISEGTSVDNENNEGRQKASRPLNFCHDGIMNVD